MKTQKIKRILLVLAAAVFALLAWKASAQNAAVTNAVPQLPYGVMQVVQLEQAKLSDDTIIAYIHNAGVTYVLTADQILYLREQGVSDAVITALLMNPPTVPAPVAQPTVPAVSAPAPPVTVPAPVTYVQPAPVYYPYYPYYYPPYGYYAWPHPFFPWVGVGWGWHGGWRAGVRF